MPLGNFSEGLLSAQVCEVRELLRRLSHRCLVNVRIHTVHFGGVMPYKLFSNSRAYTSILEHACGGVAEAMEADSGYVMGRGAAFDMLLAGS